MRGAWAQGRNYDVDLLSVSLATPGFILGDAVLGQSELGDLGTDVPFAADFTSITIDEPTTIQDSFFVHREVATLKLTATLPEMVELRGEFLKVTYDGKQLFAGRVTRAEWSESVDVDREFLPGNTSTKTYRVSLAASNGEEILASAAAQISGEAIWTALNFGHERIENLTGYPVTILDGAADIPLFTFNQAFETLDPATLFIPYASRAYLPGERQSLLDAVRMEAQSLGCVVIYQPRDPVSKVILQPVNKWLTGDVEAEALHFTDEAITSPDVDGGDAFLTVDDRVSFTERSVSEDPSLFVDSVKLKFRRYYTVGDPHDLEYGPFRLSNPNPQDVEIDYGLVTLNSAGGDDVVGPPFARAVVQTLPLKRRPEPYTSSLSTPLQSTKQLEGVVPGMAMLKADGVEKRVAVLGRTHTITPERWTVEYEMGPEHLLSRTSDREPGPALNPGHVFNTGTGLDEWSWTVPEMPTDVQMYEWFITDVDGAWRIHWYTSDQSQYGHPATVTVAAPAGTVRTLTTSTAVGAACYVMYTSNKFIGTDNPNDLWREGQLQFLGIAGS